MELKRDKAMELRNNELWNFEMISFVTSNNDQERLMECLNFPKQFKLI